jgi:hypothetical protein
MSRRLELEDIHVAVQILRTDYALPSRPICYRLWLESKPNPFPFSPWDDGADNDRLQDGMLLHSCHRLKNSRVEV